MAEKPSSSADAAQFRRLHPATIFVDVLRKLGSMIYVIVIALLARLFGGHSESDWFEYFITALVTLSGGWSLARYISLRYGLDADRLVIRSGILQRQVRTIPVDKIQNINLKRNVLHRLLGVVDVKIETAVAGQTEAALSVLSVRAADELRAELLRRKQAGRAEPEAVPEAAESWSVSLGALLLVGATENRAGLIMAGLGGAYYTFQDLGEKVWGPVKHYLEALLGAGTHTAILVAIVGIGLLIVAGWIVSIVLTVVRYYGFTLRQAEERLRRRYGLFTQIETVVPLRRIQVLRLEAPLLRRLLKSWTVHAETAGSAAKHESGGTTPLCPLVGRRDVSRFCRLAFPELTLEHVQWRPVSRLTLRRGFVRAAFALLLVAGVLIAVLGTKAWPAVPVALALAAWWAWARYRALAYAELGPFVLARAGIWTRKIWVVPEGKIQSVALAQSPFQRRIGLASVRIDTAGSKSVSGAEIVDLPYETAISLQDRLSLTANAEGLWLPDGV